MPIDTMVFDLNTYLSEIRQQTPPRNRFEVAQDAYLANRRRTLVLEAKTARQHKRKQTTMFLRSRIALILNAFAIKLQCTAERLHSKHV
ncbi:hypothetical protein [Ruegeria sp.]|uniref:hypothetical protein n=1 Tax=Ruegeria sp. TaxID=1879320 RepID=UPI003AFF7541